MSLNTDSPVATRRSTRARQATDKNIAALSESNSSPTPSVIYARQSGTSRKCKSVCVVEPLSTSVVISIPSRKRKPGEDYDDETQKKARVASGATSNHNTLRLLNRTKRRDWSENPNIEVKIKFDKVIQALLDRRSEKPRSRTAIENEKQRIALLEADPCVQWFTTVSVMCAGCHAEKAMDGRQSYYSVLWVKHRDSCRGAKELMVGRGEKERSHDEVALWRVPSPEEEREAAETLVFMAASVGTSSRVSISPSEAW